MSSKNVLNHEKSKRISVYGWKEITLKDFGFVIFQYFSINFLQQQSRYLLDTPHIYIRASDSSAPTKSAQCQGRAKYISS